MATPSLKNKLIIILIIIVATLVIISLGIIYPTVKKINELKNDITKIQNEVEQKYNNSQKLRRTMRELTETKTNTEKFTQATMKLGDELKVITELEDLALKYNIDQTLNISYSGNDAKIKNTATQYYELSFLNNGYFADHIKYLNEIEKLPYYIIIKNISLEKHQSKATPNDTQIPITLSFSAKIYVTTE